MRLRGIFHPSNGNASSSFFFFFRRKQPKRESLLVEPRPATTRLATELAFGPWLETQTATSTRPPWT